MPRTGAAEIGKRGGVGRSGGGGFFGYTMYSTRRKGERGFTVICRNFGDHHCVGREGLWWEISWLHGGVNDGGVVSYRNLFS